MPVVPATSPLLVLDVASKCLRLLASLDRPWLALPSTYQSCGGMPCAEIISPDNLLGRVVLSEGRHPGHCTECRDGSPGRTLMAASNFGNIPGSQHSQYDEQSEQARENVPSYSQPADTIAF
jgi:hypothetical protein